LIVKYLYGMIVVYVGIEIVNAFGPKIAEALAMSGLDESLRRLPETLFSLLP